MSDTAGVRAEARLESMVADLVAQQQAMTLPSFDHDDAWSLGELLVRTAVERDLAVTIDVRTPGQVLFHHARPGTTADNDRWVRRKSRTVFHFQESSWLVRQRFALREADFDLTSGLDPRRYAAHGGSVPVLVAGAGLVAALTVSGLPQHEDHELAITALAALGRR